jgi:hypothetical protein
MLLSVLLYTSIVDQVDAASGTYDQGYNWTTGDSDVAKYAKRNVKLGVREFFTAGTVQLWLSIVTMSAVSAAFKKSAVCLGDDGAVVDCPAAGDASAADATAEQDTAAESNTSDQFWI